MDENNNNNIIPERKNIPDEFKWNLEAIYKNIEDWQKNFDEINLKINGLENYSGKLNTGPEVLLKFLKYHTN